MTVEERIELFKRDLAQREVPELVQLHITHGQAFKLSDGDYYELKACVGAEFEVHHSDILIVGSGKLGFSIAPNKRYRHFCDTSDLDVAICSSRLFDKIWKEVFDYVECGEYWPEKSQFAQYHFRGWIRPDKLPSANTFERTAQWTEFFRRLIQSKRFGPYKINAALYKDWHFLERYQARCIRDCKSEVMGTP